MYQSKEKQPKWMNKQIDVERLKREVKKASTNKWKNGQTKEWMDQWMNAWMNEWMNE